MKCIVAGSRSIDSYPLVEKAIHKAGFLPHTQFIVSGGADGVDKLGETFSERNKLSLIRMLPDWDRHGRSAGFRRNFQMGVMADVLVAIWDGSSKGTAHMFKIMTKLGKPTYVWDDSQGKAHTNYQPDDWIKQVVRTTFDDGGLGTLWTCDRCGRAEYSEKTSDGIDAVELCDDCLFITLAKGDESWLTKH